MIRLMLADDEQLERAAVRNIIEKSGLDIVIVAEADNGNTALEQALSLKPDVCIVDIRMPGMSGLELVKKMRTALPDTWFVVVSAYDYFDYVRESLTLGVKEYLLKPVRPDDILKVLKALVNEHEKEGRAGKIADENDGCSPAIQSALDYIGKNYHNDISLKDVADAVPMNHFYFSRLFKKETGVNFIDYLMKVRIERAKVLLKETDMTVTEVASSVGYRDSNYFSRVFSRAEGLSPRQFRRMSKYSR